MNIMIVFKGHLKIFSETFESLVVVGSPMEDEYKIVTMLTSFPEKSSTVVTALETLWNWKTTSWGIKTPKLIKCINFNWKSIVDSETKENYQMLWVGQIRSFKEKLLYLNKKK